MRMTVEELVAELAKAPPRSFVELADVDGTYLGDLESAEVGGLGVRLRTATPAIASVEW